MPSSRDTTDRLLELERILAHDRRSVAMQSPRSADPVALHLADIPIERIRRLTECLHSPGGDQSANDGIDALTVRLLLTDYSAAVGHLRAIADIAAGIIDTAAQPVRDSQRFLKREQIREEKLRAHQAAAAPRTDQEPGSTSSR